MGGNFRYICPGLSPWIEEAIASLHSRQKQFPFELGMYICVDGLQGSIGLESELGHSLSFYDGSFFYYPRSLLHINLLFKDRLWNGSAKCACTFLMAVHFL